MAIVQSLLRRLDAPAHLIGHSYGGLIALRAAALDPARVRSIALYNPVAFGVLDAEAPADAEHEAFLRSFVDYWGGEGAWLKLRDAARAELTRVGWIVREGARTLSADATRADSHRSLPFPALLITGEHSPPAAQRVVARLGDALPRARVERIAGAGRMGPLTHGKQLDELLSAHLASLA